MSGPVGDNPSRVATLTVDLMPFWRRHLRAQIRLYASVAGHGDEGRAYRAAVVWALTTFLHGLQDCRTPDELGSRAADRPWWDGLCRAELDCPSLLELRVGAVPLSGHSVSSAAMALRQIELTRRLTVDPTTVLDKQPAVLTAWLSE